LRNLKSLLLLAIVILIVNVVPTVHSYTTNVSINPLNTILLAGQSFTVNVTIANVASLNTWQIALAFDPSVFSCTGLSIPSDSIFDARAHDLLGPSIDNTAGELIALGILEGAGTNVSGSGRLATISFTSRTLGVSALTFLNVMKEQKDGTYVLDPNQSMIPFDVSVGIVEAIASGFQKNIFSTYHMAVWTNSTVSNFYYDGTSRELGFNMAAATGTKGACIVEVNKNLLNGTLIALLDNVGLCTYSRTLKTLPENTTHCFTYSNFTFNTGTKNVKIRLTVTGDLDGDQVVDITDLAIVSSAFGTFPGLAKWNPVADLNHDFGIDITDVAIVSKNYGAWLRP
jgi:hypothetical protein